MFESIIIRPNASRNMPMDFGQVVENLFFYDKTIAHIGRSEISSLFDLADVDVLEELLQHPSLNLFFNNSHTGIIMHENIMSVDSMGLSDLDIEKELYEQSFNYKGDKFKSKKFAKKLSRLIKVYKLPQTFNKTLNEQLKDSEFLQKAVIETTRHYFPNIAQKLEDIRYELEFIDDNNFRVHSNIDFTSTDRITSDSPILSLINACEDIHVMGESSSELSAPEFNCKMVRLKTSSAIERGIKSKKEIECFNHFVYDEAWALREAINTKKIHLKPVLKVLKNAEKYKSWLKELPNDSNLMAEYVQKVEEKTIFESFHLKAIKFYLFNGITAIMEAANPAIALPLALGLSIFDTFIFEKLGQNWKPNQFVNNELRHLVKGE